MDRNRFSVDQDRSRSTNESHIIEDLDLLLHDTFGPVPDTANPRSEKYIAKMGERVSWLASSLEVDLHRSARELTVRTIHEVMSYSLPVESVSRLAILGFVLDEIEYSGSGPLRVVISAARTRGISWTTHDARYLLRTDAVSALRQHRQLSTAADGTVSTNRDDWIIGIGHSLVEQCAEQRTNDEDQLLEHWASRFEDRVHRGWRNASPQLRDDMVQESLLQLLSLERRLGGREQLAAQIRNLDGYCWVVMHNRAITEFNKDRTHRERITELLETHLESSRLIDEVEPRVDFTDPFVLLDEAAAVGGPLEQLVHDRPRNRNAPTLLRYLREALDDHLRSEISLVERMEHERLFGEDRTLGGTAFLDRLIWAAAHRRDPDYPLHDLDSAHRPMRRIRRFVQEFVLPSIRSLSTTQP